MLSDHIILSLILIYLIVNNINFDGCGRISMNIPSPYHITFLVAAVSAHYLCSLPSSTYQASIGYLVLATAAA